MTGRAIVTTAEMQAAEQRVIAAGVPVGELMERAGKAVADIAWRLAGRTSVLVLCGPGNNGGDGYVAARLLAERGCKVRVAALADPKSEAARAARQSWTGRVEPIGGAKGASLVIDALFGTGLTRPLGSALAAALAGHVGSARHSLAVDLPSGVATDSGALLSPVAFFDATVALGALKPAHLLQPAAHYLGRVMVADIGIDCASDLDELAAPALCAPPPGSHKYSRGYVLVAGGAMPGAAALTAEAAMRSGAGYVVLAGEGAGGNAAPHALIRRSATDAGQLRGLLDDERIAVAVIGPGLGRDEQAGARLDAALDAHCKLVIDADALTMLAERGFDRLNGVSALPILTPHHGEFTRLFGEGEGGKVDRAREAARRAGAIVVYKGNDTVIAAPDGRAAIAPPAPSWLASAGTGDVLTGIVAARYAQVDDAFTAACQAVWLHGEAARRAGPYLIADDLLEALPATLAACLA